jgi:hypothetical protein
MPLVDGIQVALTTGGRQSSSSKDPLYVGVFSAPGDAGLDFAGKEFPLNAKGDNLRRGTTETFGLGTGTGSKTPKDASIGRTNDPKLAQIDSNNIKEIYVKKQGDLSGAKDDAYELDFMKVELLVGGNVVKTYTLNPPTPPGTVWLGNEYGNQAWLG